MGCVFGEMEGSLMEMAGWGGGLGELEGSFLEMGGALGEIRRGKGKREMASANRTWVFGN